MKIFQRIFQFSQGQSLANCLSNARFYFILFFPLTKSKKGSRKLSSGSFSSVHFSPPFRPPSRSFAPFRTTRPKVSKKNFTLRAILGFSLCVYCFLFLLLYFYFYFCGKALKRLTKQIGPRSEFQKWKEPEKERDGTKQSYQNRQSR